MHTNPLRQTVSDRATDVWNDSCAVSELDYAISNGAVGATTNPIIVGQVLKKEMHLWESWITDLVLQSPGATEEDLTWRLIEAMAVKGAELLMPVFEREQHRKGRLSIQTNPKYYQNRERMLDQALHFNRLAPNMQVKLPATVEGIEAIEESTYHGVSINATVSFTVAQAIAVAEAVDRGLKRREAESRDTSTMSPVCTLMVGRVDDWLKVLTERDGIIVDPEALEWAGVAVMKRAYALFRERGHRTRLLAAAYRNHLHWSQFIGGDVVLTIPHQWQVRFNGSDVPVVDRIDDPVPQTYIDALVRRFPDFVQAYEPGALVPEQFVRYGAAARTLRSFIGGYSDLMAVIREFMIPNPDTKPVR